VLGEDKNSTIVQQNVQFTDRSISVPTPDNYKLYDAVPFCMTPAVELGDFLKRPVRILTKTWLESEAVGSIVSFSPWYAFFNDPSIKYKLNNYAFIRCKLHLKFIVNASPFYYGAYRFSYRPMQTLTPETTVASASNLHLIPFSQQQGVWIYPSNSQGGEMILPFIYNKDWLRIQDNIDFTNMGRLTHFGYTALQSANGATGTGVTIQVFAWAEEVSLSGPSIGLSMQGDEYVEGPVEKVSSTIVTVANVLKKYAVISPFALATSIGASAVKSIAHIFGWTNVPVIKEHIAVNVRAVPAFATPDVQFPYDKLSLDSKNELSVDPSLCGASSDDQLIISDLCKRTSYFATANWSTADAVDTILFSCAVAPGLFNFDSVSGGILTYSTPMCYVSQLFNNWRGDIIYTFKVIASPFHKGRIRISYDPQGYAAKNLYNDALSTTVVYTEIIDLAERTECDMVIPYMQSYSYLNTRNMTTGNVLWSTSETPTFNHLEGQTNGVFTIRAQTTLTAPLASSNVDILVFAHSTNMEFANPVQRCAMGPGDPMYSPFVPQGKEEEEQDKEMIIFKDPTLFDSLNGIYFGEKILSLRQLFHRMVRTEVLYLSFNTALEYLFYVVRANLPPLPGYTADGITTVKGIVTPASSFQFNATWFTPATWMMQCFVGWRGSTHYSVSCPETFRLKIQNLTASRFHSQLPTKIDQGRNNPTGVVDYAQLFPDAQNGIVITNSGTQNTLNFTVPYYNKYKFSSTKALYTTTFNDPTDGKWNTFILQGQVATGGTAGEYFAPIYSSTGPDFQLIEFVCTPCMYVYNTTPIQ